MAEKVLFEMRSVREGDRIVYEIKHPQEGIEVRVQATKRCYPPFFPPLPGKIRRRKFRHKREYSRRQMRYTLDFYERMYDELFGESDAINNGGED